MSKNNDSEIARAGVTEMTGALKAGSIDALVELANTLQVATRNEKFVSLMLGAKTVRDQFRQPAR